MHEQVGVEVQRGVDVAGVDLAGVDGERLPGVPGRRALAAELAVGGAARAVAVRHLYHLGAAPAEDDGVDVDALAGLPDGAHAVRAALPELYVAGRPGLGHERQRPAHRLDEVLAVGLPQQSVFQAVRRRHQLLEGEPPTGLLRYRVTGVRVGVDERRQHDVVAVDALLVQPHDLAVLDDERPLYGIVVVAPEDGSGEFHAASSRCEPVSLLERAASRPGGHSKSWRLAYR